MVDWKSIAKICLMDKYQSVFEEVSLVEARLLPKFRTFNVTGRKTIVVDLAPISAARSDCDDSC